MITVLTGDNSFEINRERQRLETDFVGTVEKVDGSTLEPARLPELLAGMTLFSEDRLVIIKNLSENAAAWTALGEWLPRASSDNEVVLVEGKLDKRTKTYKALQKNAAIKEFMQWTQRDSRVAEQWTIKEAAREGFVLNQKNAQIIVQRSVAAGEKPGSLYIDQWRIVQAVEKLALVGEVTPAVVDEIVDASPLENVFDLLDAALRGDSKKVSAMLTNLKLSEDPYRLFGLLGGQVFQLAALSVADKPTVDVAKDIGAHPFALGKLAPHAKSLGKNGVAKIVTVFAEADTDMKSSAAEPWLLIERALMKVTRVS